MNDVMLRLSSSPNWREELRKTCRENKISPSLANYFNPNKLQNSLMHFQNNSSPVSNQNKWKENELRACQWCTIVISLIFQKRIVDFNQEQWSILFLIFPYKESMVVRYEAQKLVNQRSVTLSWQQNQESIFQSIMEIQQNSTTKWSDKALQLFKKSEGKYLRTGKQCRQKWMNSLNPLNNRAEWNKGEDVKLAQLILKRGRKWSALAKDLASNRTEHMIKKRYKTIVSHLKKIYPQIKDENLLLQKLIESSPLEKQNLKSESENQINQTLQQPKQNEIIHQNLKEKEQIKRKAIISSIQQFFPIEESNESPRFHEQSAFSSFRINSPQSQVLINLNSFDVFQNFFADPNLHLRRQSFEG